MPKFLPCFLIFFSFLLITNSVAIGQDIHFSQMSNAPLLLGPAETGNFFGDWQVTHSNRRQWGLIGKPYSTLSLGYEHQFYIGRQKLSAGLVVVHDESGIQKLIQQRVYGSVAFHQTLRKQEVSVGIQAGYVAKTLDISGLTFPSQYDIAQGLFNDQLANREGSLGQSTYFFDVNVGVRYRTVIWKLKPEFGFSIFHLNQPYESLILDSNNFVPMRYVGTVNTPVRINNRYHLQPQLFFMYQRRSRDLILGTLGFMNMSSNKLKIKQTFAGLHLREGLTRNWDAFIFTGGLKFKHLQTALSYDITVSKLRLANSYQGAIELSVIYTGVSSVLNKRSIPCNRM